MPHGQALEGTEADALKIAGVLFSLGRNVMLYRPPSVAPAHLGVFGICIFVDNQRFGAR